MRVIAFDTETGLIRPGMQAPELVCVTWADGPERAGILHWSEAVPHLAEWLRDPSTLLVGHNTAYDLAVICQHDPRLLPLVFEALEAGRITCTMLRAQLQDCAAGTLQSGKKVPLPVAPGAKKPKSLGAYSLAGQVFTLFGQDISEGKSGPDVWRLRYAELRSVPLRDWPEAARGYAVSDAQWTWNVYQAQAARANPSDVFGPEFHESRAAFAFRLMECHGVRTDSEAVAELRADCQYHADFLAHYLRGEGIVRADGTEDQDALRARVSAAYARLGKAPPLTDGGAKGDRKIKTDADTLRECAGSDWLFGLMAALAPYSHALSNWVPLLERGQTMPIHARYNLLLNTGRTSASPNLQNPPRDTPFAAASSVIKGLTAKGIDLSWVQLRPGRYGARECFVPRPEFLYSFVDFNQLELCTLAQNALWIVGRSEMAEAIRAGKDLHSMLGAQIIGTTYDDLKSRVDLGDPVAEMERFHAKAAGFGFPGGMGPDGFVLYARGYGLEIERPRAAMLKSAWLRTWPEMSQYFYRIKGHFAGRETATMRLPVTGLYRGECWFTEACNFLFQGLAAAGAKRAGFNLARECFAVPTSPLYGSRPAFFLHDEWGIEVPEVGYSEAADRQAEIMIATMSEVTPDVPIKVGTPAVSRRWYKKAKGKRDASGRLLVWEPKQ